MRWTCGDESVENLSDFSAATQKHIVDNIAKALSEILSDQYECKVMWKFEKRDKTDNGDVKKGPNTTKKDLEPASGTRYHKGRKLSSPWSTASLCRCADRCL